MTTSTPSASCTGSLPYPGSGDRVWRPLPPLIASVHVIALIVAEAWVLTIQPAGWRTPGLAIAALWLILGPALVVCWRRELHHLDERLAGIYPAPGVRGTTSNIP